MTRDVEPVKLGLPLAFEGEFDFRQADILKKIEEKIGTHSFRPNYRGGKNYELEVGDAGSTAAIQADPPHTWNELKRFNNYVERQAAKIFEIWGLPFKKIIIDSSWFNRHGQGGMTNYHVHAGADLVLAAYIKAEPNSGNLLMIDPLEYHWFSTKSLRLRDMLEGDSMPVASNKVYFFAPFIRHATEPNESGEDRFVISYNIQCIR
jgi:uncharacterized protein (TIGR02466 family)